MRHNISQLDPVRESQRFKCQPEIKLANGADKYKTLQLYIPFELNNFQALINTLKSFSNIPVTKSKNA
jgi:hypothetical protein